MVPNLAVTSKRFQIAVYSSSGELIYEIINARNPQLVPEINTLMFETEGRLPTTLSAPTGIIFVQEMTPSPEEEVAREANLIVEG